MNTEPLEATAWTLLIIAVLFILGFSILSVVDVIRTPRGQRGLKVTPKQKGFLFAMAAASVPPLLTELLMMHSFSPFLLLAAAVPIAILVVFISRRVSRPR